MSLALLLLPLFSQAGSLWACLPAWGGGLRARRERGGSISEEGSRQQGASEQMEGRVRPSIKDRQARLAGRPIGRPTERSPVHGISRELILSSPPPSAPRAVAAALRGGGKGGEAGAYRVRELSEGPSRDEVRRSPLLLFLQNMYRLLRQREYISSSNKARHLPAFCDCPRAG